MIKDYIVVDVETTGLNPVTDQIIEISAIKVLDGKTVETYEQLIHPGISIESPIVELVGITDEMVKDAPGMSEVIGEFLEFTEELPIMGHNLLFDYSFLKTAAVRYGKTFGKAGVDTLAIARKYLTELESRRLDALCSYFGISDENHHRALNDAMAAGELYRVLCEKFYLEGENDKDFAPIPLQFSVKKVSPATAKQLSYLKSLMERYGIEEPVQMEQLTKSQASKMIDHILFQYGR